MKTTPLVTILANIPPSAPSKRLSFYFKKYAKLLMNRRRGPDAVLESLKRGLRERGIPFNVNPNKNEVANVVHALSGPEALKLALYLKSEGLTKKIMAGPNISILPTDDDKLLLDPLIDTIIVPSEWIKEAYTLTDKTLAPKLQVWPSGVHLQADAGSPLPKKHIIVFKKVVPEDLFRHIIKTLAEKGYSYRIVKYGHFLQKKYFELLRDAEAMIYLQEVESQGLALQEAWAANVPTLVWNKGTFTYPGTSITIQGKISAPYLTEECGASFGTANDFDRCFDVFMKKLPEYTPRAYCDRTLSDNASIDRYLKIVDNTLHG